LLFELDEWMRSGKETGEYRLEWRQLYFFRRMCITVIGISSVIDTLSADKDFKAILKRRSKEFIRDWESLKKGIKQAVEVIKPIRHQISAHVEMKPTEEALKQMQVVPRSGLLQIHSDRPVKTHYKFTDELLMGIIFKDIPPDDQGKVAEEMADKFTSGVGHIFGIIDTLFLTYASERGLI